MNHFGQEKEIIGRKIKAFIGQLIFLLDILLEGFLEEFLTLLDLLKLNNFKTYGNSLIINIPTPATITKQEKCKGFINDRYCILSAKTKAETTIITTA